MPIKHRDAAFATMLLTCALSPDREELVHPLSVGEFHQLRQLLVGVNTGGLGQLIGMDISGLMRLLDVEEATAYRLCMLLGRVLPLTYMLEGMAEKGVDMMAYCDEEYPEFVKSTLPDSAPPVIYACGDLSLMSGPAVALLGISGVKLSQEFRESIHRFVETAVAHGYTIVTGGELGVMYEAEKAVLACGGRLVCVVGGELLKKVFTDGFAEGIARRDALCLSLAHPEALFTVSHAAARMRLLFALSDAVFVLNTDLKRGETDAMRAKSCKWVYALTPDAQASTNVLAARGARAIKSLDEFDFPTASRNWALSKGVQMSLFDLM